MSNGEETSSFGVLQRINEGIQRLNVVTEQTNVYLKEIIGLLSVPQPSKEVLTIRTGDAMPLTVDSTNAKAVLTFEDDHGDIVPPPTGIQSSASSDNTSVLSAGAANTSDTDANGNTVVSFPLTPVAVGTANLSVFSVDSNGNPLVGPDGTTPIANPAPVSVTVNPGAAAEEVFTVND